MPKKLIYLKSLFVPFEYAISTNLSYDEVRARIKDRSIRLFGPFTSVKDKPFRLHSGGDEIVVELRAPATFDYSAMVRIRCIPTDSGSDVFVRISAPMFSVTLTTALCFGIPAMAIYSKAAMPLPLWVLALGAFVFYLYFVRSQVRLVIAYRDQTDRILRELLECGQSATR
ncbi:MAG: hypothetical protein IT366_05300 [Candidatus Hydrogenedentes bacterium]|nr:hypothetical protein [Candidatus Hydrogenedentota bacterium]